MSNLTTRQHDKLATACRCEVVRRGPNWLFVRVDIDGAPVGLGERLWRLAESQFTYRLVVEFDAATPDDTVFATELGVELGRLCDRLGAMGGALRMCGLDPATARRIVGESGCPRLHNHATEIDAVLCGPCNEAE